MGGLFLMVAQVILPFATGLEIKGLRLLLGMAIQHGYV